MALTSWATHVLQWALQRVARAQAGANPQKRPQFGSRSATRPREGGIASNRGSERRGEYVPGPCTHRPSSHERRERSKPLPATRKGAGRLKRDF
jgi:hypothetical protein